MLFIYIEKINSYILCRLSSDTESFFLPFDLLLDNTFLPALLDILSRKPCLFFLFLREGWYVLFIAIISAYYNVMYQFLYIPNVNSECKNNLFFYSIKSIWIIFYAYFSNKLNYSIDCNNNLVLHTQQLKSSIEYLITHLIQ